MDPSSSRTSKQPTATQTVTTTGPSLREVPRHPYNTADIEELEDLVAEEFVWQMLEDFEAFHQHQRSGPRPGADRGYAFADIVVVAAASTQYKKLTHALRNLSDQPTWDRLRSAAEAAFPHHPTRRLSPKAPTRSQTYRANRDYFAAHALAEFKRSYRAEAVRSAKEMNIFDPKAGSWGHPHKRQAIAADMTWIPGATRWHWTELLNPDSKAQRIDENADHHHTRGGQPTEVPGRKLVVLSCRTGHGNERVPLDAAFMPRPDHHSIQNRNEADVALDMVENLIAENPTALRGAPGQPPGLRCFIHDMALDSEGVDRALGMKLIPLVKVRRTKTGHRDDTLGPYEFTTLAGGPNDPVALDVRVHNGTPWVRFPYKNRQAAVPLERVRFQWSTEAGIHVLYGILRLPDHAYVPKPLRGATTRLRFNSTQDEIHHQPFHRRRTRFLRPIPEADRSFKVFGLREDVESLFSDLKSRINRKLPSIHEDFNDLWVIAYMMLRLSRARTAHRKRTTAPPAAVPKAA